MQYRSHFRSPPLSLQSRAAATGLSPFSPEGSHSHTGIRNPNCFPVTRKNSYTTSQSRNFDGGYGELHGWGSPGASFTSNMKQELVAAVLDLRKSDTYHEKLLELFHNNYHANRLKTPELDQAARIPPPIFHELSCLYYQQASMRKTLQSLDSISDEDLGRVDTWRKVSAVLFTAAAAANTKKIPAGAAAAVSILLIALGKWTHSILMKSDRAAKKRKEIIGVMIFGAKIDIEYLSDIYALALRLNFEAESNSETAVDGERRKSAAVKKSFEALRLKVEDYNRGLNWATEVVLRSVITHLD